MIPDEFVTLIGLVGLLCLGAGLLALRWAMKQPAAPRRELSEEEKAELARRAQEAQADKELFEAIEKEARLLVKAIPAALAMQNKLTHLTREKDSKGRRTRQFVGFEVCLMTRTEIWFRFDGRRLPYGVSFTDLTDPANNVIENLQHAIRRPCRFHKDYEFNLFLRVGLKTALMGIPKTVHWSKVVRELPASRPFAVAMGVNENNKLRYQDITDWPHGVIAGGTGMGKTTWLKQALATLITRNRPEALRLVIVDLKRVELREFRDVPHTLRYADLPEQALETFAFVEKEMDRRYEMFAGTAYDIDGWNRQNPHRRLCRIFLVVDELASLTTNRHLRQKTLDSIVNLAQLGRAAGIHLVLATQTVRKEVLPMSILANIDGRLAFSVASVAASTLVIGDSTAVGLGHVGRAVLQEGPKLIQLQAPYASDSDIAKAIQDASEGTFRKGAAADGPPVIEHIDLLKLALYNYGGQANYRDIYNSVKEAGGRLGVNKVRSMIGECIYNPEEEEPAVWEIDGQRYILLDAVMGKGGKAGRQLVAVNGYLPQTAEEVEELAKVAAGLVEGGTMQPDTSNGGSGDRLTPIEAEGD